MIWPLVAGLIWLVVANVIGLLPSRDKHWRNAYILIAVGVPILGWVFYQNGVVWGLVLLAAAVSVLRWPVVYAWRWVRARLG